MVPDVPLTFVHYRIERLLLSEYTKVPLGSFLFLANSGLSKTLALFNACPPSLPPAHSLWFVW